MDAWKSGASGSQQGVQGGVRDGVSGDGGCGGGEAQGLGTVGKVPSYPLSWDRLNPALAPLPELKLIL